MQSLQPSPAHLTEITGSTKFFLKTLKEALVQAKLPGQIFVGGSFAKGTLLVKEKYDVDLFIRFKEVTPLSIDRLEKVLLSIAPQATRVHGSRDYFQIPASDHLIFEVIPVKQITKPQAMENVTDLSYFHVAYVTKHMTQKLAHEIALAKAFCTSAGIYGAESYIQGFSGYALECLLIHYRTFRKMLQKLLSVEKQLCIDPAKHYRSSGDLLRTMSESRRAGPLIIVDPTWKERNVAAALSYESFSLFQKRAKAYLARPHDQFFEEETFDLKRVQKEVTQKKGMLFTLSLETDKQAGDLAGTKLRKFHLFVCELLKERFTLIKPLFRYERGQTSVSYYILKTKQTVQEGPLLSMTKHAHAFKKMHPSVFVKKGRYYRTLLPTTPQAYVQEKVRKELLAQMDITRMHVD